MTVVFYGEIGEKKGKKGEERGRKGKHQKVPLENVVPLPLTKR